MIDAQVLIVGGGPAGAAAAYDLACAGLDVLVLERARFPRAKPCAGGVTVKAARRLRFSIQPVVREQVTDLELSLFGRRRTRLRGPAPICFMTHRPELDAFCLEKARQAGARFQLAERITGLSQQRDCVELRAGKNAWRARWVVGADGAHSAVRRLAMGQGRLPGAMAIEALVPREACRQYPGMSFDFGVMRHGYGWLFPKGDHVNAGLYVWRQGRGRPGRRELGDYVRSRLGTDRLEAVQGYPEGTWAGLVRPGKGRVLLAGDAAGMAEPLLGEGIYGAIVSGQQAAAAILAGDAVVATYTDLVGRWRDEVVQMEKLARLYYGVLPLGFGILKHGLSAPLMAAFAGGWTLGEAKREWLGARLNAVDVAPARPPAYSRTSGERRG